MECWLRFRATVFCRRFRLPEVVALKLRGIVGANAGVYEAFSIPLATVEDPAMNLIHDLIAARDPGNTR
jgi:hypothetical protein